MRFTKLNNLTNLPLFTALFFLSFIFYMACNSGGGAPKPAAETAVLTSAAVPITISPVIPTDIPGGAPNATLSQAAAFAWQEFIALNWPAQKDFRDSANAALAFGSQGGDVPLVWHTFRHKVEIFPAQGKPNGYNPALPDLGYNSPPQYNYNTTIPPYSGTPSANTPYINLDEINEIGVTTMFAGVAPATTFPGQQILFLAKANKPEYVYVTKNNWNAGGKGLSTAQGNTKAYIQKNSNTPPPNPNDPSMVSFPYGTIEIKTAWRRLTDAEKNSGRFFSTTVRYYRDKGKVTSYVDEAFGMIALHIIHKTPTAPYFVFATFEQADNILTTDGKPVEDVDGNIIANQNLSPLTPNFKVTNATPTTVQTFSPDTAISTPGSSVSYQNITAFAPSINSGLPGGTVTINRRINSIPQEVISTNQAAHQAIATYNQQNNIKNSPWPFYKLVNVQYKPIDKTPGVDYTGADVATYYLSNSVVESDYILQKFSGQFSTLHPDGTDGFTITDYRVKDTATTNAYYNGKFLMGGCMGCHGNATNGGSDYSFILSFHNTTTQTPGVAAPPGTAFDLNSPKLKQMKALMNSNK